MKKLGLLPKVLIAIVLGIALGAICPDAIVRIVVTFKALFGNFLGFVVPLIILGLIAPGIANMGARAGKLLLITVAIAYGFSILSGFLSFFSCAAVYPHIL